MAHLWILMISSTWERKKMEERIEALIEAMDKFYGEDGGKDSNVIKLGIIRALKESSA